MYLRRLGMLLLLGIAVAVLAFLFLRPAALARQDSHQLQPDRQNVILIVADDMRHDGLSVMSTLTSLAEQRGVTFPRAFVTTPLCCPSRASLLTGQYARTHGVLENEPPLGGVEAFDDRSTLATWLQASGVRTGLVGRYMNGYNSHAVPPGWDDWFATGQDAYSSYYDYRVTDNGVRRQFGDSAEEYSTRVFTERAIEFIGRAPDRPFFLWLGLRAPHAPAIPDSRDEGRLRDLELPLTPAQAEDDLSDKPSWIQRSARRSGDVGQATQRLRRLQLETLLGVDRAVGELVGALASTGQLERTWLIFTSDNGITLGEHGRPMGKQCAYEECIRVPLVIIPPLDAVTPYTDNRLAANIDLAPTIAALLGAESPPSVQGRSLLPLGREQSPTWRDALLFETWAAKDSREILGIRTADRKYVFYGNGEEELYDLVADPHELDNAAADPASTAHKGALVARLRALLDEVGPGVAGASLP